MESPGSEPSAQTHDYPPEEVGPADSSLSLVPPYWSHRRYESYSSVKNSKPAPITLEDHTEEPSEQSGPAWAKGVTIDDYVLVSGTVPNVGKFVVWNCKIETLDVSPITLSCTGCPTAAHRVEFAYLFASLTAPQGRVHHSQKTVNASLNSLRIPSY